MPGQRGAYRIFASVAQVHRRKLNQDLELPTSVKCILRGPDDENSWKKLEALRVAICAVVEGEREVFLQDAEEVEAVAAAIEACTSEDHEDEVGEGSKKLAPGSRVMIDIANQGKSISGRRKRVAKAVRGLKEDDSIIVRTRPVNTCRSPPLDDFAKRMFRVLQEDAERQPEEVGQGHKTKG